jgi:hypothetical protein
VIEVPEAIIVTFHEFPLGAGYNKPTSDLVLEIPRSYPDAPPDMFWLDDDVTLAGGAIPRYAESTATINGRRRRRFSWHRKAWNASIDNLHGHLEFIRRRFLEKP